MNPPLNASDNAWQRRLEQVVDMMRELSRHTEPNEMVQAYGQRVRELLPYDRLLSVSRRELEQPWYRITRNSDWGLGRNPWKEKNRLPLLNGGLLAELLYNQQPQVIDQLEFPADDPAAPFLAGMQSLIALPVFDNALAMNMVVLLREKPASFDRAGLAEQVWTSNLFGRATENLLLSAQIKQASEAMDTELRIIGDLQRSLLPWRLPNIPTMNLAVHYEPAARCGGDYYDFFPMADDNWGFFIADVSGHGSPAAVLMAVTHVLAHTASRYCETPAQMLDYINHHLTQRYTTDTGRFVTAFFGLYDPSTRQMTYACGGHNAPRVKRCSDGSMFALDGVGDPPLGIDPDRAYDQTTQTFQPGDQIIFYTDGVTEAFNSSREMFGLDRLDRVLHNCSLDASALVQEVLRSLNTFTADRPADDDRTLLVAKVT